MLKKNFLAHKDKNCSPCDFRFGLKLLSEQVADFQTDSRQNERNSSYYRYRNKYIYPRQKGESYSCRESVYARIQRKKQKTLKLPWSTNNNYKSFGGFKYEIYSYFLTIRDCNTYSLYLIM